MVLVLRQGLTSSFDHSIHHYRPYARRKNLGNTQIKVIASFWFSFKKWEFPYFSTFITAVTAMFLKGILQNVSSCIGPIKQEHLIWISMRLSQ